MNHVDRAQQVRQAVLEFLAQRQALSFSLADLVARLERANTLDFRPEPEEITAAVAFLLGFSPEPLISERHARLGPTLYYQATSAGVLAYERGTLEE